MNEPFSGSYHPSEVSFLLRRMNLETTSLDERERMIQSGTKHYSEMIGPEDAPTRHRMGLFRECLAANGDRLAQDLSTLAAGMAASAVDGKLTIVSIARAGTPIGVLLWHRIRAVAPELKVNHYSISVIRDRGVDYAAVDWISRRHFPASIRFVDGWTGKGTIADELRNSIGGWKSAPEGLDPGLWVPLDVCGAAVFAASDRDYLIPSTLLGGTLSGLVSRSVLPAGEEGGTQFHGCVPLDSLRRYDLSRWFIGEMKRRMQDVPHPSVVPQNAGGGLARREETFRCLNKMLARQGHEDRNRVKLGIGETVRVLLRRKPQRVWLGSRTNPTDAALITRLAEARDVPVIVEDDLPFDAIAGIARA
jgi:hypothetical protein